MNLGPLVSTESGKGRGYLTAHHHTGVLIELDSVNFTEMTREPPNGLARRDVPYKDGPVSP